MKGWVFYAVLPAVCWAMFTHQPVALAQTVINDLSVAPCSRTTGLPKTSQIKCYNAVGGEISCTGSGQDAMYADPAGSYDYGLPRGKGTWASYNATRFINNTDGTVTDTSTGLMWVANSTAAGRGGTYDVHEAVNASENLTYATYSDWRLPNINELQSIVSYDRTGPTIDTTFFVCVAERYWSSTKITIAEDYFWGVEFDTGEVNGFDQGGYGTVYMRPVRSIQ